MHMACLTLSLFCATLGDIHTVDPNVVHVQVLGNVDSLLETSGLEVLGHALSLEVLLVVVAKRAFYQRE